MIMVKSILHGEYRENSPRRRIDSKQVDAGDSSSGYYADQVTTIEDEDDRATDEESCRSTELGDSFVLAIDWETTNNVGPSYYHETDDDPYCAVPLIRRNNGLPESPDDPYLQPLERVRRRLCNDPAAVAGESAPPSPIRSVRRIILGGGRATDDNSPLSKSLGSFHMPSPAKSLGSFLFPAEEEEHGEAEAVIEVPLLAQFGKSASFADLNDVHDDEEDDDDRSLIIPTMITPMKPVTPSRKRRLAARRRASELKEALDGQSQKHLRTAHLHLQLGLSEQQAYRYLEAITSFFHAAAIFRHYKRPAAIAAALDQAAVTYCQAVQHGEVLDRIHSQHKLSRFHRCLREALHLRKHELGPCHVDTVDTLQHWAQLYLLTGEPAKAATHYQEVVYLRMAIFGPHHPGTAVAAHCLGNAYLQSHNTVAAEAWYSHALEIYNHMDLPSDNPAVARLLRDRKRLERVERWIEEDPGDDEALLFEL